MGNKSKKSEIISQLFSLREKYLDELEKVSCTDEKMLKPMFQNMKSYQRMITEDFLNYAKTRFIF